MHESSVLIFLMQWKKEMASQEGPPGYDPAMNAKPKTKSVKRNERKKEKRLQVLLLCCFHFCSFSVINAVSLASWLHSPT